MAKTKPILRDAETKDLQNGSLITMMEKLVEHEMGISDIPIIDDLKERKRLITEKMAHALVDPDQQIWVVEKSGRILGYFMAYKAEDSLSIEKRNPICIICHAFNDKTVLPALKIHNRIKKWAKEKGCKGLRMLGLAENENMFRLMRALRYKKTFEIWETGV